MASNPLNPIVVSDVLHASPAHSPRSLKGILISEAAIQERVSQLATLINQEFADDPPIVVGVLKGTILFFADLVRRLIGPIEIDFIGVSSYRNDSKPGSLSITQRLTTSLENRRVLVIDDILDGGQTLETVLNELSNQQPTDIRSCVLLERTDRRQRAVQADFVGFRIPDYFVVGYGLDYAEQYRNLPYVAVLKDTHS